MILTPAITQIGAVQRDGALLLIEMRTEMGRPIGLRLTQEAARKLFGMLGCAADTT